MYFVSSFNFECLSLWEPFDVFKCKWKIAFEFFSKILPTHRAKQSHFFSGAFRLTCFTQCKRNKKKQFKPKINSKKLNRNKSKLWNLMKCSSLFFFSLDFSFCFCFIFICIISQQPSSQWNIIHVTLSIWWSRFIFVSLAPLEHWTWKFSILELAKADHRDKMECVTVTIKKRKKQHHQDVLQTLCHLIHANLQYSLSHANLFAES